MVSFFFFCKLMDLAFPQSLNLKRKNLTNTYAIQTHPYKFNNIRRHIVFGHTWILFSNNFGPKHYHILFAPGRTCSNVLLFTVESWFLEPPNNSNQKLFSLDWFHCSFTPNISNFWFLEPTSFHLKIWEIRIQLYFTFLNYFNKLQKLWSLAPLNIVMFK